MKMKRALFVLLAATSIVAFTPDKSESGHYHTCFGERVTMRGSYANDVITGTPGRDVIVAQSGQDFVYGNGGPDLICGNSGNDTLVGGDGRDKTNGGKGDDICEAERRRKCE